MPDFKRNLHNLNGRTDVDHIPALPLWIGIVRIAQLILAIIVLGLTAFSASELIVWDGDGMAFFTFAWTLLFLIYLAVSIYFVPTIYNIWAHLAAEALTVLWWLVTWALLASEASAWDWVDGYSYHGINYSSYIPSKYKAAINCSKAAAGLGALEWILFVVTLVFLGLAAHRLRSGNTPGTAPPAFTPTGPPMEEHGMAPVHNQTEPQYQQQQYQQQQMA